MRWMAVWLAAVLATPGFGATRLKDLAALEGVRDNQLIGYGLVVGLAGTGDRQQTLFSPQSLANLLERMGVSVPGGNVRVKNTAAVMIVATQGTPSGGATAITLLSGVEAILQAAPNASQAMMLSPWSLGGAPAGDLGQ